MLSSVFTWVKEDSISVCVKGLPTHLPAPRRVKEVVCSPEFEGLPPWCLDLIGFLLRSIWTMLETWLWRLSVILGCGALGKTGSPEHGAKVPSRASHPFNSKKMPECQTGSHCPFLCLHESSPLFFYAVSLFLEWGTQAPWWPPLWSL